MAATRAVGPDTLGAWLLKAGGGSGETVAHHRSGFADVRDRCVRPSYRTDLVTAGQPVLLWVSGDRPDLPAGIHAHGRTSGPVRDGSMPVELAALADPLLRAELVHHPVLSGIEVLRMPAGSNPSYVTPAQLRELVAMRAELA